MLSLNKKSGISIILAVGMSFFLSSCYEKFDESSYAPKFTISGFSAVKEIEPASLVAYMGFEGNLVDSVSNTAGANSGTTFVKGFKGTGLNLDVANKSYVTLNSNSSITGLQSFTISFWVNPTFVDANADKGIDGILGFVNLSNTDGFWGNIDWFVENNSNNDAATIKAHVTSRKADDSGDVDTWIEITGYKGLFGAWTSHTLTYNAATSEFVYYINGSSIKKVTAAWTGPVKFTKSGPMVFGTVQFQTTPSLTSSHGAESWASYLSGSLDEVRIYNKALSAESVNALVVLQGKGK